MKNLLPVFVAALALAGLGCRSEPELVEPPTARSAPFEGTADPKFVGTWKSEDNISVYTFKSDGAYELESTIEVRGQKPIKSRLKGEWRVNGSQMLFKDASASVVPYSLKLDGDRLELGLAGSSLKNKTVLRRQ